MKLADYLKATDTRPSAFAAKVGCPPSTITRILRNERSPGLELMARIRAASEGKVSANDFLPTGQVQASSEASA